MIWRKASQHRNNRRWCCISASLLPTGADSKWLAALLAEAAVHVDASLAGLTPQLHSLLRADADAELQRMWRAGQIALGEQAAGGPLLLLLWPPEQQLLLLHAATASDAGLDNKLLQMLAAMERRACDFAIEALQLLDLSATGLIAGLAGRTAYRRISERCYQRSLGARMGSVRRAILQRCRALGIPADYGFGRQLPMQRQASRLVTLGTDCFQRQQFATAATAAAWRALQAQAHSAGVDVQLVSAYRSHDYQQQLLQRKLQQGQRMEDILLVSAAPGFSEHHSGRALDLTSAGWEPLSTGFANSDAHHWLQEHAVGFGFIQSYPRNNVHGIAWEPWHWCWQPGLAISE